MKTASKIKKCGAPLKVQRYGGGSRYYCSCDVRKNEYGMPMIQWTNADPPVDRLCNKRVMKRG